MLGLKLPTDPRWANIAEENIEEILSDHAFCEQKAASMAISFIVQYPEYDDLVEAMSALVKEEMSHFQLVHQKLVDRGLSLGHKRSDDYVNRLRKFFPQTKDRKKRLVLELLVAALIEARSCERFRVLSENIADKELAKFYRDLMASEANHYTMFLGFARQFGERADVDKKWQALLDYEGSLMQEFGKKSEMHG